MLNLLTGFCYPKLYKPLSISFLQHSCLVVQILHISLLISEKICCPTISNYLLCILNPNVCSLYVPCSNELTLLNLECLTAEAQDRLFLMKKIVVFWYPELSCYNIPVTPLVILWLDKFWQVSCLLSVLSLVGQDEIHVIIKNLLLWVENVKLEMWKNDPEKYPGRMAENNM